VYAGELQSAALGMKIKSYDEHGAADSSTSRASWCAKRRAPSMPLYFWNDPDGSKYHKAYFDVYPGVWRHGDYMC
jgi:acetoacetyl-CoA synthetase